MNIEKEFRKICAAISDADRNGGGSVADFEPLLVSLLKFCEEHEAQRAQLISCFEKLVDGIIEAPEETVPFSMRTLRYPEIKNFVNQKWGREKPPRLQQFVSDINHAYDDEVWEHGEVFEYYRSTLA